MAGTRIFSCGVMLVLIAANVVGQTAEPAWFQRLLPSDARVIETALVSPGKGKARLLVLWMIDPKRVIRQGEAGCSDWVYGDHWYGPTRLSLFDSGQKSLINTLEVRGLYEGADEAKHSFPIPFHVSNGFYYVPQIDNKKEGTPRILNLRDLTGEGVVGQFVLLEYEVCGTALTTVLGYSSKTDNAVQFQLQISEPGEKLDVVSWVPHIFGEQRIRPGYWNFTWEPGHGADCWIHEQVTFDPTRALFVDHRKITPYPSPSVPNAAKKSKK